jgi:hypothetical protein
VTEFVKLKDAKGRTVQAQLDPEARLSAGRETLSDGTLVEPWVPRQGLRHVARVEPPRVTRSASAERRLKEKARRKMNQKARRKGR